MCSNCIRSKKVRSKRGGLLNRNFKQVSEREILLLSLLSSAFSEILLF